uniref:Peptidase S8/S53 domain-containing protein n=1 Tax=Panagrolaimus sp. ES5 TaxID=591445 RepID=A0AC34FYY1_9BILA
MDGTTLELHTCHGYHGTSVAQIAAGYLPDDPKGCGIATDAQVIVFDYWKYTGNYITSFEEVFRKCVDLKVDVINVANKLDRDFKFMKMVIDMQIVVVYAAGNTGPLLASMKENPALPAQDLIVVGSALSSDCEPQHPKFKPVMLIDSARGPLENFGRGISLAAPGFAVVEASKWTSSDMIQVMGTSFAAPVIAGGISCLISALKSQSKKAINSGLLKMALQTSAVLPESFDGLSCGDGIPKLDLTFDFIIPDQASDENFIFNINTANIDKEICWSYAEIGGFFKHNDIEMKIFTIPVTVILPFSVPSNNVFKTEYVIKDRIPYRFFFDFDGLNCKMYATLLNGASGTLCVFHLNGNGEMLDKNEELQNDKKELVCEMYYKKQQEIVATFVSSDHKERRVEFEFTFTEVNALKKMVKNVTDKLR